MGAAAPRLHIGETLGVAKLEAGPYLVLSLYLDVDTRHQELVTIRSRAHSLIHQAREELERRRGEMPRKIREAARADLERCRIFIDGYRPRGTCRGLALFSCAGRNGWQEYPLPRPVPDRFAWNHRPLILPALYLIESYPRTGVVLLDRHQGRFFASRLGEVEEWAGMREEVHRRVRSGGWQGREERRIEHHVEDELRRHVKHVAAQAHGLFQDPPVTWLLVGGNPELFEEFRHALHSQLLDRWAANLPVSANASLEQVQEAVLVAEQELLRQREAMLLDWLYDAWRTGRWGIVGVADTLRALYRGEVETLIVDAGLHLSGYRCDTCAALGEATRALDSGSGCGNCGSDALSALPDLVDATVDAALSHGGEVEVVSGQEGFRRDGGLGALLRFSPR